MEPYSPSLAGVQRPSSSAHSPGGHGHCVELLILRDKLKACGHAEVPTCTRRSRAGPCMVAGPVTKYTRDVSGEMVTEDAYAPVGVLDERARISKTSRESMSKRKRALLSATASQPSDLLPAQVQLPLVSNICEWPPGLTSEMPVDVQASRPVPAPGCSTRLCTIPRNPGFIRGAHDPVRARSHTRMCRWNSSYRYSSVSNVPSAEAVTRA
eukprot:3939039-Rhodomonas_salina.1